MKFYLINPDYMLYGDPPLGLAALAAYIMKYCSPLDVKILDQMKQKDILEKIRKDTPELVCLAASSGNFFSVKQFANEIKEMAPTTKILFGGVHITTCPESFENGPFDIAVRGEGEIATRKVVSSIKKHKGMNKKYLSKIPGLLFKDEKGKTINTGISESVKNLDELPLPARHLLNMKYYTLPRFSSEEDIEPIGSMLTARGCPFTCKFCSSASFWGRGVRFHSAKRVVEEIEELYKKYGYRHIYFYDDLFSLNRTRLEEMRDLLKEKGLLGKIRFSAYARANCFDDHTAKLFKELNVHAVTFGLETGSQRLLNYLKGNDIKITDGKEALKRAKKYGLDPKGFFIIGSPSETVEDMKATYNFIKENCKDNFIIYQALAYPGTEFWKYAVENGLANPSFYEKPQKEFVDINPDMLLSKEVTMEEFTQYYKKIKSLTPPQGKTFLKKMLRIRPRHLKKMLSNEFMGKAYNLRKGFMKRLSEKAEGYAVKTIEKQEELPLIRN